jgi:hypothetical protein
MRTDDDRPAYASWSAAPARADAFASRRTATGLGTRAILATWRLLIAASLAASGAIHAQLYLDGYRFIHGIGILFLLQSSASLGVAVLLLFGAPPVLRIAAAALALGALGGFIGSRTVGVLGFTERGFQPAPQAVISVLVEVCTLLLLLGPVMIWLLRQREPRSASGGEPPHPLS